MTIQPVINVIEGLSNLSPSEIQKSSSIEQINEFIKGFESGFFNLEEATAIAHQQIEDLDALLKEDRNQNLPLVRKNLGHLLDLKIEAVTKEVIKQLKPLLDLSTLIYNVENQQFKELIVLEKQISQAIFFQCQLKDSSLLFPLINLYTDMIEHLSSLPPLFEDRSPDSLTLEEEIPQVMNLADSWLRILEKETIHNPQLNGVLKKLQKLMQLFSKQEQQKGHAYRNLGAAHAYLGNYVKSLEYYEIALTIARELNDQKSEAICFNKMGLVYISLRDNPKAIKSFEKSLQLAKALQDQELEGKAYESLGVFHFHLQDYPKSIEHFEAAIPIFKKIRDIESEGSAYGKMGEAYFPLGDLQKTLECFERSLKIAQAQQNLREEGIAYKNLGKGYIVISEFQKAIECCNQSLKIALQIGDQVGEGNVYGNLGIIYRMVGEHHKGIDYLEKVLKIALAQQDLIRESQVYGNLGNIYLELAEYQKSINYFEKGLRIFLKLNDREGEDRCYSNLGIVYRLLGEPQKAIDYLEKALKISVAQQNLMGELQIYGNLGSIYKDIGEYQKAIDYYEKSLTISLKLNDREGEMAAYANLGDVHQEFGKYRKSIELCEKSLQIAKEIGRKSVEGNLYGTLGTASFLIGEHSKAIEYQEKKLQIAQDLKEPESELSAYANIGSGYDALKNYGQAKNYVEKALEIALKIGNRNAERKAYGNLGSLYHSLGEYQKSINYLEKSIQIAIEIGNQENTGSEYINLCIAYASLNKYQKAIEYGKKALQMSKETGNRYLESAANLNLGSAYNSLEKYEEAKGYYLESIAIHSKLQHELGNNAQWKISLFEEQFQSYVALEASLIKQNKLIETLEITEERRGRALLSSISNQISKGTVAEPLAPLTVSQIQKIAKTLQTSFMIYSFLPTGNNYMVAWFIPPQGEITSYQLPWDEKLSLDEVSKQLQYLVKEVENLSSIKRGNSDELDFDLDDLDLEAELNSFLERPEVKENVASEQAEKTEKDQNALKRLKEEKLRPWYDLLIAPLETALPAHGSSITIIPDGVLSQFPFGAFCDKQGTYLIEKYAISLAPSIKTLQLLHQLPQEFPSTSLIVGSPDTGNPQDQLKVADREAQTVATLINGSQLLSQKQATISHVSQQMQEARFIHLACHGLAKKKYDKHSVFEGLFKLAPDESDSKGELYAQQIAALNLKAELVFLSACYSGKGNVKQEGSIGPVWSFLGAGAKSTVATYWPLPDSATTFEMVESFYKEILNTDRASLNKAQVLRQVTLKAMEKNRDDFIQWGAFFLSGVSIDAKLD